MDTLQPKQKTEVQFNGRFELDKYWAIPYATNVGMEFQERMDKIIALYEELITEMEWNNLVYSSKINFKPVVGRTYYLYEDDASNRFLSLIAPNEWRRESLGGFRMEHTGKWLKVD